VDIESHRELSEKRVGERLRNCDFGRIVECWKEVKWRQGLKFWRQGIIIRRVIHMCFIFN